MVILSTPMQFVLHIIHINLPLIETHFMSVHAVNGLRRFSYISLVNLLLNFIRSVFKVGIEGL